jgi:hypothetical protein
MSTKAKAESELIEATAGAGGAGGLRSEPGGQAQRAAGAARRPEGPPLLELPPEVRDRLSDPNAENFRLAGRRSQPYR